MRILVATMAVCQNAWCHFRTILSPSELQGPALLAPKLVYNLNHAGCKLGIFLSQKLYTTHPKSWISGISQGDRIVVKKIEIWSLPSSWILPTALPCCIFARGFMSIFTYISSSPTLPHNPMGLAINRSHSIILMIFQRFSAKNGSDMVGNNRYYFYLMGYILHCQSLKRPRLKS